MCSILHLPILCRCYEMTYLTIYFSSKFKWRYAHLMYPHVWYRVPFTIFVAKVYAFSSIRYTVEYRYSAVKHSMILHVVWQRLRKNMHQRLYSQRHPIARPWGWGMGCHFWRFGRKLTALQRHQAVWGWHSLISKRGCGYIHIYSEYLDSKYSYCSCKQNWNEDIPTYQQINTNIYMFGIYVWIGWISTHKTPVKTVCNEHLCNKNYYLWFIQ